ncbi:MAG: ABC transporter ATP-binding protein [Acidimicrobiaceae bacterium]|nr:ABC transporter ATP-binding protein [Acidimicrobiaceae bacterium]
MKVIEPPLQDVDGPLLAIDSLAVEFAAGDRPVKAVNGVTLDLWRGETLGIIGESGSGKSALAMSVLRLLPSPPSRVVDGRILLDGENLLTADSRRLRDVRGRRVSMIFQDPGTSLHPSYTIGFQLREALRVHDRQMSTHAARSRSAELLASVGIGNSERRLDQYPHEFSGGMRQRVMIAMAIANQPSVVIADEPTTALDVTIQAEILDLLRVVKRETDAAVVFITHDLRVVAQVADRVAVMYAGSVVESGPVGEVFADPRHPYTAALLRSLPALEQRAERQVSIHGSPPDPSRLPTGCAFHPRCDASAGSAICVDERPAPVEVGPGHASSCHFSDEAASVSVNLERHRTRDASLAKATERVEEPVLRVESLTKRFALGRSIFSPVKQEILAVDDVDFDVYAGETMALVGESGSGKSTTARLILRLHDPTSGRILFGGVDLAGASGSSLREARRRIQMVFQDPYSSLNPRLSARQLVAEPLRIQGLSDHLERVEFLLDRVGLSPSEWDRRPDEFSGGQRQRIAICRALVLQPEMLVLDEAVSALDVSIQAQVLNLLGELQDELELTYLFISHDLAVIRQLADNVAVMFAGRIVEHGEAGDIFGSPRHPYTRTLLEAIPGIDPAGRADSASVQHQQALVEVASHGCPYRMRCPIAQDICTEVDPALETVPGTRHRLACHFGGPEPGSAAR